MESELDLSDLPGVPVLVGIGGSNAYGLATPASDIDYRGCYVAPTKDFFGLDAPAETHDQHDPDMALHEVAKLLRLAMSANPTVLELFYYDTYVHMDVEIGPLLLDNRELFITEKVRDTHVGFAMSQLTRLSRRENDGTLAAKDPKKIAKHARHLLRLIQQAERALTTGVFDIHVADRDEIFAFGELPYDEMAVKGREAVERLKKVPSVLPKEPDRDAVNDLLVHIRTIALNW
jgi:predicted nucleotidyltransferase